MNILIACERSQIVMKAFRDRGHNVYSCDTEPCYGGQPQYHIIADVLTVINGGHFVTEFGKRIYVKMWDMMIAHPPCTFLTFAAIHLYSKKKGAAAVARHIEKQKALEFFYRLYNSNIKKIAIENPRGFVNRILKPSQTIQPWNFGDPVTKATCLWLKNLPPLQLTFSDKRLILYRKRHEGTGKFKGFTDIQRNVKKRSETFQGIANAMATQWG